MPIAKNLSVGWYGIKGLCPGRKNFFEIRSVYRLVGINVTWGIFDRVLVGKKESCIGENSDYIRSLATLFEKTLLLWVNCGKIII